MDELAIRLRFWNREKDEAFIYSSWRNQAYFSALERPQGSALSFFKKKSDEIRKVLDGAIVMIAYLEDSPDVIAGYAVTSRNHLNWIYVKEAFRKAGIGKLLTPTYIETYTNQVTKIGKVIAEKKNLTLKGE